MPSLIKEALASYIDGKRLAAPLMGFPGLNMTAKTIRVAQEDHKTHFAAIEALAREFKPDIIFPMMDLTLEAIALGMPALIPEDEPASIPHQPYTKEVLERINKSELKNDKRIKEYLLTLEAMELNLPAEIIKGAYVTGPFTLAGLIMGADETALSVSTDSAHLHELLEICTRKIMSFIKLIYKTGINLICILEPTASLLTPEQLKEFSSRHTSRINNFCSFQDIECILHICGNTTHLIDAMLESGIKALSLDSAEAGVGLPVIAEKVESDVLLIGNLNPTGNFLNGDTSEVSAETLKLLKLMEKFPNFILSSGCDLPKQTPLENIKVFIETARSYIIEHQE